jgi:hypothetical protein
MGGPFNTRLVAFGLEELHVYQVFMPIQGLPMKDLRDEAVKALNQAGYVITSIRYSRRLRAQVIRIGGVDLRIARAPKGGVQAFAYVYRPARSARRESGVHASARTRLPCIVEPHTAVETDRSRENCAAETCRSYAAR